MIIDRQQRVPGEQEAPDQRSCIAQARKSMFAWQIARGGERERLEVIRNQNVERKILSVKGRKREIRSNSKRSEFELQMCKCNPY